MIDFKSLPVWQHRQEIVDALKEHQVIVVESPTGSGKTTQLPLILKEAGYAEAGVIGITQPRRIATLSVCDFIKKQIGDENGQYCGYKMRFTDTSTNESRIKIMTDGILLMELKTDPTLSKYSVMPASQATGLDLHRKLYRSEFHHPAELSLEPSARPDSHSFHRA